MEILAGVLCLPCALDRGPLLMVPESLRVWRKAAVQDEPPFMYTHHEHTCLLEHPLAAEDRTLNCLGSPLFGSGPAPTLRAYGAMHAQVRICADLPECAI